MVDGDGMTVDVSCDAAVLIGTVEAPGGGKIKLPNYSHHVERAHGLNLLTCARRRHRGQCKPPVKRVSGLRPFDIVLERHLL